MRDCSRRVTLQYSYYGSTGVTTLTSRGALAAIATAWVGPGRREPAGAQPAARLSGYRGRPSSGIGSQTAA
jgi:hypothetical protein